MEHTQMHLALKRVQTKSITLAILEEFLVNSLFHETINPNSGYEGLGVVQI
jgi:hypothetical protein